MLKKLNNETYEEMKNIIKTISKLDNIIFCIVCLIIHFYFKSLNESLIFSVYQNTFNVNFFKV